MNNELFDNADIERTVQAAFGLKLDITKVVARSIPTGYTSSAVLFHTAPNVLYCLVRSQGTLLLADLRKLLRAMNVDAYEYLPPHGDKDYFRRIGIEKFKAVFPGKHITSDDDTRYYQTLAPYNPALVKVERVKGEVRAFHSESKSWRKIMDYAYSHIPLRP